MRLSDNGLGSGPLAKVNWKDTKHATTINAAARKILKFMGCVFFISICFWRSDRNGIFLSFQGRKIQIHVKPAMEFYYFSFQLSIVSMDPV